MNFIKIFFRPIMLKIILYALFAFYPCYSYIKLKIKNSAYKAVKFMEVN